MPLVALTLRPGINKQATRTLNEGGFSDGNRVRFRSGMPEAIGGWQRAYPGTLAGVCRGLHAWSTLLNDRVLAAGTHTSLYVGRGGKFFDITPDLLPPGTKDTKGATGFGTGPYGRGTWGTSRSGSTTGFFPRIWSLDNWGEELIATPRDGPIYRWRPTDGIGVRAGLIPGAPAAAKATLVGMPERHLIALGAEIGGTIDPMLVRWSDVENYTIWNATATNSAGSFRLQDGSEIIGGLRAPLQALIWTDAALIAMQFIGGSLIYGFNTLGTNCGLIAPQAAAMFGGSAYWMSHQSFMTFAGTVRALRCDVQDEVFGNINTAQIGKVECDTNSQFEEVTWRYPSAGSNEIDSYVTYCPSLPVGSQWTIGKLDRTCWIDAGVFAHPIAVSPDGVCYYHETGESADGSPIGSYVETGYIDIADGDQMMMIDQIIPDFTGTQIFLTQRVQDYPGGKVRSKGPLEFTPATTYKSARSRGRQVAFRIECGSVSGAWRLGKMRVRMNQDGSR